MNWYLAVLKNYAGFRGRARRREYWIFVLVNAIIGLALLAIGKLTKMPGIATFGIGMSRNGLGVFGIGVFSNPIIFQVYALATFLPFLAVEIRRLHDIGRTGWWLAGLVPVLGWFVLVVFCATDGAAGDNRYGLDPRAHDPRRAPQGRVPSATAVPASVNDSVSRHSAEAATLLRGHPRSRLCRLQRGQPQPSCA